MTQPWDILRDTDFEWLIYFVGLIPQLQDEGRKYWTKILSTKKIPADLRQLIQNEAFNSCPVDLELVTPFTRPFFFPQLTEEQFNDLLLTQQVTRLLTKSELPKFKESVLIFSDICTEIICTLRSNWLGTPDLLGFDWFLFVYYYPKIFPLSIGPNWSQLASLILSQLSHLEFYLHDVSSIQSFTSLLNPSAELVLSSWSDLYKKELSPYIFAPLPFNLEIVNQIWSCICSADSPRPSHFDDIFIEFPLAQAAWNR